MRRNRPWALFKDGHCHKQSMFIRRVLLGLESITSPQHLVRKARRSNRCIKRGGFFRKGRIMLGQDLGCLPRSTLGWITLRRNLRQLHRDWRLKPYFPSLDQAWPGRQYGRNAAHATRGARLPIHRPMQACDLIVTGWLATTGPPTSDLWLLNLWRLFYLTRVATQVWLDRTVLHEYEVNPEGQRHSSTWMIEAGGAHDYECGSCTRICVKTHQPR
jgi:hypothetical protein